MYLPPYFFLPEHIIFSKNNVFWQVCQNILFFESQHFFQKKYCVADMAHNTIFFEKK